MQYLCTVETLVEMVKIFTSAQLKELDDYTIAHEPIRSIDLMERAAKAMTRAITEEWTTQTSVVVFAGPGNNGGDALAVGRMLAEQGYQVSAYLFNTTGRLSEDCAKNRKRMEECRKVKLFAEVVEEFDPPKLTAGTLVVDGLFGTGMSKPLSGGFASLVKYINQSAAYIVSLDMPSGLDPSWQETGLPLPREPAVHRPTPCARHTVERRGRGEDRCSILHA